MQLVFDGSSVYRLNLPNRGGKLAVNEISQMRKVTNQASRIVNLFLAWIEYLITTARSTDIAKTVRILASAVLTVMKPKV